MSTITNNYRRVFHMLLAILAGLVALAALKGEAMAQEGHTFIIPADAGYGTQDCMGKDRACARVVASAWCEAHGLAAPLAYGPADQQGSVLAAKSESDAFMVTCKD